MWFFSWSECIRTTAMKYTFSWLFWFIKRTFDARIEIFSRSTSWRSKGRRVKETHKWTRRWERTWCLIRNQRWDWWSCLKFGRRGRIAGRRIWKGRELEAGWWWNISCLTQTFQISILNKKMEGKSKFDDVINCLMVKDIERQRKKRIYIWKPAFFFLQIHYI